MEEPLVAYPIPWDLFIIDTDAINVSIGTVLLQIQEEKEVVISYGSRRLSTTEKNYCTTRKKLLTIIYFVDYYSHYLLGGRLLVRTHQRLR